MDNKLAQLIAILQELQPLALAYSGGLDSRFLAYLSQRAHIDFCCLHVTGQHIPKQESTLAINWLQNQKITYLTLEANVLDLPDVQENNQQRCFSCKKHMFTTMLQVLKTDKRAHFTLCDGTNADDLKIFRPGQKALQELGIKSPLSLAHFTKAQIQSAGEFIGLDNFTQQASPCLLTRFAYNIHPNLETLQRLDSCETELRTALAKNLSTEPNFRVRLTPAYLLQIDQFEDNLRPMVREIMAKHGFTPCYLAVSSQISGFFDQQNSLRLETLPKL